MREQPSSYFALPKQEDLPSTVRLRAVFAVSVAVILAVLDYVIANVALPTIAQDIHTTPSDSIWVINAYQLSSLIALLPLAALSDRLGHARICRLGLVLFLVASFLCASSHTLPELAAARVLQGLGGACIMSVNTALVRYIYPQKQLGRGIAFNGLVVALGVALGPTVAAGVLSVANWQWLFLLNLPLGGLALLFAATSLPDTPTHKVEFDSPSAALLAMALGGLVVGGDRLAHHDVQITDFVMVAVGAVSLFMLVRRQHGRSHPLLPVDLLRVSDFRAAFLTGFTGFVASNFFMISMPFMLEMILHRSAVMTGLLMTPWPVAIAIVSPLMGRLAERHSAGLLSTIGLFIVAVGFFALRELPSHPSDFDIAWRIGLAGAGFGVFQPPNNKAMISNASSKRTGSASGMISFARLAGQTIGAMLVAFIFAFVLNGAPLVCLSFATGTAVLAAVLSATRLRRPAPVAEAI